MTPNYTLSPLSRVVVRKTHAVHAARKLKDAATRKLRKDGEIQKLAMLGSQSMPCLVKTTPEHPHHDAQESVRSIDHTPSERKAPPSIAASKLPAQLSSLATSSSTSSLPPSFGATESLINSQAALLAAVSAAGLYGAAPPRAHDYKHRHDDAKHHSTSLNATQQKKKAALNRRKRRKILLLLTQTRNG